MNIEHTLRIKSILCASIAVLLAMMSLGFSSPANAFPQVHDVTFVENASPTDSVSAIESGNSAQPLTLLQDLNPTFSNVGYTFDGWSTSINGGGSLFADGANYSFGADMALYAQWTPIVVVHDVTLFENANVSDSISALESGSSAQALTLVQNLSPTFSNGGYTFEGWNTSPNGSGTSYSDGSLYPFNADSGLYAQWTLIPVVHDVTLFENDSASDLVRSLMSGSAPMQIATFASLQPAFANPGHSFAGWNTAANGNGITYMDGANYSFNADIGLYAQWKAVAVICTVTFNENDSASDIVTSIMSESASAPLTLLADLQPTFQNASLKFSGWNTARNGTGTSYTDGSQFAFNADLVLYAQWTRVPLDTISFNANGGSGTVTSISGSSGSTTSIPNQTGLIRAGFTLISWNTDANGSGTNYQIGEVVTISQSTVLYAQWSGHKLATLFGAIGTFKSDSAALSTALKSQVNRVAATIKSRKYLKVDLFGYTAATGLKSLNMSLSRSRARNVALYLRNRLQFLKVRGVSISSSGQGSIAGQSSNAYSRVEVFGV